MRLQQSLTGVCMMKAIHRQCSAATNLGSSEDPSLRDTATAALTGVVCLQPLAGSSSVTLIIC